MANGDIAVQGMDARGNQALIFIDQGDIRAIKLDLSDYLATGDTISSVVTAGSNLAVSAPTIAAGVLSFILTGPTGSGYADITATLSTGEKITQRIHAQESQPTIRLKDYAA